MASPDHNPINGERAEIVGEGGTRAGLSRVDDGEEGCILNIRFPFNKTNPIWIG